MANKQAKAALLALIIVCSASPIHAQWQWLTSLKAFIAPLIHQVKEYPQLTAAFTLLSFGCISSVQYALKKYRAYKATTHELTQARLGFAAQNLAQKIAQHTENNKKLDDQLTAWQQCHREYDAEIAQKPPRVNEYMRTQQEKNKKQTLSLLTSRSSSGLSSIAEEDTRDLKSEVATQTAERDLLQTDLASEQKQVKVMTQSSAFIAQAQANSALARAIKDRQLINIDAVLQQAQQLLANQTACQELKTQIMHMIEQLESVRDRAQENAYERLKTKYTNQMQHLEYTSPLELYRNMKLIPAQAIASSAQEIEQHINDQDLERIFCGAQAAINPLAKENYDAFLLGKEATGALMPTPNQKDKTQKIHAQLMTKLIKLDDELKKMTTQGAINVSKK